MTPDHKFQLLITLLSVAPATYMSALALRRQRRQQEPTLEVLTSPVMAETTTGKEVLAANQWPGIVVRNPSPFPLRICNVGYCIGRKFYEFGRPLVFDHMERASNWPWTLEPHARIGFHVDLSIRQGRRFVNALTPIIGDKFLWEVARAYAVTECGRWFYSKRISRKGRRALRAIAPITVGTTVSVFKSPFVTAGDSADERPR